MASGKTIEINNFDRAMRWRSVEPVPKKDRDRTLNGKARIRARRAKNMQRKLEQYNAIVLQEVGE